MNSKDHSSGSQKKVVSQGRNIGELVVDGREEGGSKQQWPLHDCSRYYDRMSMVELNLSLLLTYETMMMVMMMVMVVVVMMMMMMMMMTMTMTMSMMMMMTIKRAVWPNGLRSCIRRLWQQS